MSKFKWKVTPSGCWEWQGKKNLAGYGYFKIGTRKVFAHRFFYERLFKVRIGKRHAHHTCFNHSCVNPLHLQIMSKTSHEKLHRTLRKRPRRQS